MIWLYVLGYLVGILISLVLLMKVAAPREDEKEVYLFFSTIWPLTLAILIITVFMRIFYEFAKKLAKVK